MTDLVELIVRHPQAAASCLEREVLGGTDPLVVSALLDAAEALALLRAVQIGKNVASIKRRVLAALSQGTEAGNA